MTYPYTIKVDRNKITVKMARQLSAGGLDAVGDVVAALSVDSDGNKPDRQACLAAFDDLSLAEMDAILELIGEDFTPKAS